jgi:Zn-dependent protease with chaperone function
MRSRAVREHVVSLLRYLSRRFSLSSLAMFALALLSELPVLFVRIVMLSTTIGIFDSLSSYPSDGPEWLWVGALPTLWAALALLTPSGSGWWWKQRSGGRSPSAREQLAYDDALELLQSNRKEKLALPSKWFVIDTPLPDAAVQGETLMLSRGLMESDHLPAVIAHELGHLASPDGRIAAALNRLVVAKPLKLVNEAPDEPPEEYRRPDPEPLPLPGGELIRDIPRVARFILRLLSFAQGGTGLRLTQAVWGHYWRGREYAADAYAAKLGQADELADFLETHALLHDHPIPYIWLTEHTHPPVELRINRLRENSIYKP